MIDWCMLGFPGLRVLVVLEPGSVDNLVIRLSVVKCISIADAYKESPVHEAGALGIRRAHEDRRRLL